MTNNQQNWNQRERERERERERDILCKEKSNTLAWVYI